MLYLNDDIAHFDFEAALPLLSEQRREQALKFKHELGRKTCAAAYLLLCEALRKEYGITEKPVFEYSEHGKPMLVGFPKIHFNFSHCREAVVCVVSDHPVGVDVESIREYKESLVNYTMNEDEAQQIIHSENPALTFTKFWTRKEALLKLTGEGIGGRSMKEVLTGTEEFETVVCKEKNYVYSVVFGK